MLILLIDDIGVDKVGSYGSPYAAATPTIDALARQGVQFDNAYAAPLCSPARAMLLTGRLSRRTGIGTITERSSNASSLPLAEVTIPEALAYAPGPRWANGAIGKWHLAGPRSPEWAKHPNRQGFEYFAGSRGNPQYKPDRGYERWSRNLNGVVKDSDVYLTTGSVDDALTRIAEMPEPWFLYVAFNAAHVPIHRPPDALLAEPLAKKASSVARHDAMVEAMDTEIGRLIRSMDQTVLSHTTIITLADNGTSRFGLKRGQGPNHKHIKHSVYQGGVRVPMVVTGPHVAKPGSHQQALVHITDLFPTVLDLAGLPMQGSTLQAGPHALELDGISLLPLLRGKGDTAHTMIYAERFEPNGGGPFVKDHRSLRSSTHELVRLQGQYDRLYRLEGWWEGKDLLQQPLSEEDHVAYEALKTELDRLEKTLVYNH